MSVGENHKEKKFLSIYSFEISSKFPQERKKAEEERTRVERTDRRLIEGGVSCQRERINKGKYGKDLVIRKKLKTSSHNL